jgi:hypothetical protein
MMTFKAAQNRGAFFKHSALFSIIFANESSPHGHDSPESPTSNIDFPPLAGILPLSE